MIRNRQKIRTKIFISILIVTALPLTITVGIIWNQYSENARKEMDAAQVRIEQDLKEKIIKFQAALYNAAYPIYANYQLLEDLEINIDTGGKEKTYEVTRGLRSYFLETYYTFHDEEEIQGIYLIDRDGRVVSSFFINYYGFIDSDYAANIVHPLQQREKYTPIAKLYYDSLYHVPIYQYRFPVRYKGTILGMMVIDLKETYFREMVEQYNVLFEGKMMITDEDGEVIYHTDQNLTHKMFDDIPVFGDVQLEIPLSELDWRLHYSYRIDPKRLFFRNLAVSMIILSVGLAIVFSILLSYNITKPILHLQKKMTRIQLGDFSARAEIKTKDEVAYLGTYFNLMADRIQELIEHDLKHRLNHQAMQIKALQAQISPHFLYNTFQMMANLASIHNVPDLKLICQSLSNIYRYNTDIHREWVQLKEEIMHIRNYLVIINKRYPKLIKFHLRIEPDIRHLMIPKFILQPLIENAIEHALIPSTKQRRILKITGHAKKEKNSLFIHVMDNGIGMEAERLAEIKQRLGSVTQMPEKVTDQIDSIGMFNIQKRIQLLCGDQYGITIASKKEKGTVLTLKLPLKGSETREVTHC